MQIIFKDEEEQKKFLEAVNDVKFPLVQFIEFDKPMHVDSTAYYVAKKE